jgi:competence protein ComEA
MQATPAELVGLAVLLAGAVAVTAVVFWDAGQRPTTPPAASVGDAAMHDDHGSDPGDPIDPMSEVPDEQDAPVATTVTVHVSGAVGSAGVVTLAPGARVADAIEAAGGATLDAELDRLNLARLLLDGEQVHVPRPGEDPVPDGGPPGGEVAAPEAEGFDHEGRIDLNRATHEQLETLPGIGPAKAAAIVTHRETEGPFAVPGDIRAVPGIGEQTFQRLADLITVG